MGVCRACCWCREEAGAGGQGVAWVAEATEEALNTLKEAEVAREQEFRRRARRRSGSVALEASVAETAAAVLERRRGWRSWAKIVSRAAEGAKAESGS
jgi:hypothetical protein